MNTTAATASAQHYTNDFYADQIEGSLRSARIFVSHLCTIWQPTSVVDIGCGRGAWLKAFGEQGISRRVGFDGSWNSQAQMIDSAIAFRAIDLRKFSDLGQDERYDLSMSLEVAEHLEEEHAQPFVDGITHLADAVLFGAAYVAQGGTNHINE